MNMNKDELARGMKVNVFGKEYPLCKEWNWGISTKAVSRCPKCVNECNLIADIDAVLPDECIPTIREVAGEEEDM